MKRDSMGETQQGLALEAAVRSPAVPPEEADDDGTIRISETVIASIVRKYTMEVPGVVRFASGSIVGGLAEIIGRKSHEGSVAVDIDGDSVNISVTLVLAFGVRVPEVATAVQTVIRQRVEDLTGKHANRVNVVVQDLEDAPPKGG